MAHYVEEDEDDGEVIKHVVVLYDTPEGIQESCDNAPFALMRSIVEAGDKDRLWFPEVLVYKGNCSEYIYMHAIYFKS